jgi:hypothetical protein
VSFGKIPEESGYLSFKINVEQPPVLGDYRWLSFWIKGDGRRHLLDIHIRCSRSPETWAQFHTKFVIQSDGWERVYLDLKLTTHDVEKMDGRFKYFKNEGDPNIAMSSERRLAMISFVTRESDTKFELEDITLEMEKDSQIDPIALALGQIIDNHQLRRTYEFAKTDPANTLILADEKKTDFVICLPAQPSETELKAGEELAKYLNEATGAVFAVCHGVSPKGKSAFILGKTAATENDLPVEAISRLQPDAFLMKTCDASTILIVGGNDRGLLYGVYAFLEKAVGVRWFSPFATDTVVPVHAVLKIPGFEDEETPVMNFRWSKYGSRNDLDHRYLVADWAVKARFNVQLNGYLTPEDNLEINKQTEEFYLKRGGRIQIPALSKHNYQKLLPPEKFFADHPEYYCYEIATGKHRHERAQICCTNPDVACIIAEQAGKYFDEFPGRAEFFIGQEDGARLWCQCEECRKLDPPGSQGRPHLQHSDRTVYLANAVAAELEKTHPGKIITTWGYAVSEQPPLRVTPAKNVKIEYCYYAESSLMPVCNQKKYRDEILAWAGLCPERLRIYDYVYSGFFYQFACDETIANNYRFYSLAGVREILEETNDSWGINGYVMYLAARLAWNPWIDVKNLRDDYYAKLYGNAAEPLRRFQEISQEAFNNLEQFVSVNYHNYPVFTDKQLVEMAECLSRAREKEPDQAVQVRISSKETTFTYIKLMTSLVRHCADFCQNKNEDSARKALEEVAAMRDYIKAENTKNAVTGFRKLERRIDIFEQAVKDGLAELATLKQLGENKSIQPLPQYWTFHIDPDNVGEQQKWFEPDMDDSNWAKIRIGDFWEPQGYDYDGIAWYRCSFTIPDNAKQEDMTLVFMAVDERAWVYLDGRYVGGHHEGNAGDLWKESFRIDISEYAKPGQLCRISVRVHDSAKAGGIYKPVFFVSGK